MEASYLAKPSWATKVSTVYKGDAVPFTDETWIHGHIEADSPTGTFLIVGEHGKDLADKWNAMFSKAPKGFDYE